MHKMLVTSALSRYPHPDAVPNAEVFRTSVTTGRHAAVVLAMLQATYPHLRATLDLDDSDRILRVEDRQPAASLPISGIQRLVTALGFKIEMLAD